MANLKAALIGCGGMGRAHANAGQALGVDVVAFCDVIESAAESAREEFGGRYATTDAGRIMRDDSIDLLYIATHHDAHHPLAIAGAQAGKHMMLEKPMCIMRHQAVEVAEAVEKAGVKAVVDHWFRIQPTTQKIRELIPHPRLSHGQLAMENYNTGRVGAKWLWDKDDGGGLLVSTAVHTVDLLCYLMDSAGDRVYAESELFEPEHKGTAGYPDVLVGTIQWQSGGLSTIISTDQGFNPAVSKWFHEVWDGERSAVLSSHTARVDFGGADIDTIDLNELSAEEMAKVRGAYPIHANLLEAIRTDGDTICNVHDGVKSVSICNALDAAARTGKPQDVAR